MPFVVNPSEGPSEETMFPSISTSEEESPIPSSSETTLETKIPDIEAPSAKPIATSTGILTTDALLDLRFASTQFTATLPEGRYSNAIISLKPAPLNKGMPSGVIYSIDFSTTMKNETFPFSIREDNGIINVFGEIDREFNDLYEFIVTATLKQGDQEISDSALVQVRIDDVNDNAPEFITAPHVVALSSDTRVGSVIANFTVIDNDEGAFGTVSFSLDGELKDYFAIDNNGILTLSKELSPSLGDKMNIAIVAADGGRPALKTVHMLTVELYSETVQKPVFKESEYSATVSPNASRGQFVAQVVAGIDKFNYAFDNSYSDLFMINEKGVITLGRNPLRNERNKQYLLNLTATDGNKSVSTTTVKIFLEGQNISQLPTSAITPIKGDPTCEFKSKVYNTEIRENTPERRLLAKVEADCKFLSDDTKVLYIIHQGSKEFEMNETTGELFVNAPLDRENRTLHFVVVNLTIVTPEQSDTNIRNKRKSDAIIEYARSKLLNNQALIVVKVLDENDNLPVFSRTNSNNEYVFPVDWQLPLKPIGRIQATYADENKNVTYTFSESSEYFSLNSTSGVVNLIKSLEHADQEVYDMEVQAFDGKNTVTTRVKIYPLMPGVNIIVLTAKNSVEEINELAVSRELTQALEMDTRVLVKRVYVNEDNSINREKSLLLIYALRKETHEPVPAEELKEKLEKLLPQLKTSQNLNIENISLPPPLEF
uniref:Cadherin domain-containing protein n=1 Tax=Panagrolaimus davidi TaxID=227884 RepID=A0A914PIS5_9BILA